MDDEQVERNMSEQDLIDGDLMVPLSEDNDTPFSDPSDIKGTVDTTHPSTDSASDIDSHQLYDEGLGGAAEASEPNAKSSVVEYNPKDDQKG